MNKVAFQGIGSFLPEEVRTNDWWPDRVVTEWTKTALDSRPRIEDAIASAPTQGQRAVLEAMLGVQADPFRGVRQRHGAGTNRRLHAVQRTGSAHLCCAS